MIKKYKNDIILLGTILIISIIAIIVVNIFKEKGTYVVVVNDQKEVATYSIEENIEIKLSFEDDKYNILVIKDGYAYIKDATCKDHICVKHNKISMVGETIVCLPNKIVIKITGDKQDIDVTT